jgi:hypothetical protein
MDARRPYFAVKGQTKKHEKKAGRYKFHYPINSTKNFYLPPAWSRLAERELTFASTVALMPISFWNEGSVRTPPTMPVS